MLSILQARTSSTRLPGKVMLDLCGAPMLQRQIERVRRAHSIGTLVVATSDRRLRRRHRLLCAGRIGVACHRGPLDDVLARYQGAAEAFGPSDHIVRLTGDCPLADPEVIDAVIASHLDSGADYTSNTLKLTFPKGQDVEVFRAEHLAAAVREAVRPLRARARHTVLLPPSGAVQADQPGPRPAPARPTLDGGYAGGFRVRRPGSTPPSIPPTRPSPPRM